MAEANSAASSDANLSFEEKYGVASSADRSITTGNSFVMNAGLSPVPSYNFMLRVEGVMDLPCKSIRAFSKEMEYELIQEGGLNDYVYMKRKPISKPFYFEVERYIGVDYIDPLPLGAELLLPVLLLVGRNPNNFAAASRIYTFTGCTVIKKDFGQMDAERSGLFVETTTIAYRELVIVDVPWSESYGYEPNDPNPKRSLSQDTAITNAKAAREAEVAENEAQMEDEALEMQKRKAQYDKDAKTLEAGLSDEAEKARQDTREDLEKAREAQREKDEEILDVGLSDEAEKARQDAREDLEEAREEQREKDEDVLEAGLSDEAEQARQDAREDLEEAREEQREKDEDVLEAGLSDEAEQARQEAREDLEEAREEQREKDEDVLEAGLSDEAEQARQQEREQVEEAREEQREKDEDVLEAGLSDEAEQARQQEREQVEEAREAQREKDEDVLEAGLSDEAEQARQQERETIRQERQEQEDRDRQAREDERSRLENR